MRCSFTLSLLCVGLASATGSIFAPRVLSDDKTCAERWGKGSIICSSYNCFNPTLGEQCCGGGYNCVGTDNSCCSDLGPGVTGTAGVPEKSTLSKPLQATPTRILPGSSSTSTSCSGISGEECCQRLSTSQHWCSGSFPDFLCYNPDSQSCCSDGSRCAAKNCCALVSATAITPNATQATAPATGSITSSPTTAQTDASQSTNPAAATTTSASIGSDKAAIRNTVGGIAFAALCSLAIVLL